jgi:hypothetical protein
MLRRGTLVEEIAQFFGSGPSFPKPSGSDPRRFCQQPNPIVGRALANRKL